MAKASRQTFKKRQREMAKKQKREDKAKRLAARKIGENGEVIAEEEVETVSAEPESMEKKPGLVVTVRTSRRPGPAGK
jgi:hypothetical protein